MLVVIEVVSTTTVRNVFSLRVCDVCVWNWVLLFLAHSSLVVHECVCAWTAAQMDWQWYV